MTEPTYRVVASRSAVTLSHRTCNTPVEAPGDLPGVVIFLHGVNDPGASYQPVEKGLCDGLNDRLGRQDLRPGLYGEKFSAASKVPKDKRARAEKDTLDDPDTWLYQRTDQQGSTHSMLIPFYWGYRASDTEIKRKQGVAVTLRGQYLDVNNNRLDRHFAKNGGFFPNATNSIPQMYRPGFDSWTRHAAQAALPHTLYMGRCPHRKYFVLAAHRLAMLVSEIRGIDPNETITIIGHSQGTLITLLAQALLVDRKERCADTVIMVDSPYSLLSEATPPGHDTLDALIRIVGQVNQGKHAQPVLSELLANQPDGCGQGRTGPKWTPEQGHRLGKDGTMCVFPERDNRGKVYLYFCPDDSTVGLDEVRGIGTFGVPDTVTRGKGKAAVHVPAMTTLVGINFLQRMWTKRHRDGEPVWVGKPPTHEALRARGEPRYATGATYSAAGAAVYTAMEEGERRYINAEALVPPHAPAMFAGETVQGSATTRGKDRPDEVSQANALGNPMASFDWVPLTTTLMNPTLAALKQEYNQGKAPDEQTERVTEGNPIGENRLFLREATPKEIREHMARSTKVLEENSYHSAMLRDPGNHQWVTAMDVAIGQARCLDDPQWREVLMAMADWKMTRKIFEDKVQKLANWTRLSEQARALVEANCRYYDKGIFPSEALVPLHRIPPLVTGLMHSPARAGA
jgi:uncharacterized protein DUF3274